MQESPEKEAKGQPPAEVEYQQSVLWLTQEQCCLLHLVAPPWMEHPQLHYCAGGSPSWQTAPMHRSDCDIYSYQLTFSESLRFVFCSGDRKTWLNPDPSMSSPHSWVGEGANVNFRLEEEGEYVVVGRSLERVRRSPPPQNQPRTLMVINADGVLCGEEATLLQFNRIFMRDFYFDGQHRLIYTTGRPVERLFSEEQALLLPAYVISEGGSRIHHLSSLNSAHPFELIWQSGLSSEKHSLVDSLVDSLLSLGPVEPQHQPGKVSFTLTARQYSDDYDRVCMLARTLREHRLELNMVSRNGIKYVDITAEGVDKATALAKVIDIEGAATRVVGFGSALNDAALLRKCH